MDKYLVSIACKVPVNWECAVKADSEDEAVKIAMENFVDPSFDDYETTEPYMDDITIDIDMSGKIDSNTIGINVEVI